MSGNKSPSIVRQALVPFLLAISCVSNCTAKELKTKRPPISSENKAGVVMTKDVFGLKNDDYFDSPMKKIEEIRDRLEDENKRIILAGGPAYIPIDKVSKFPLSAIRVTESLDASTHLFKEFAIVTAMDISTDQLFVDMLVEQKFVKSQRDPKDNPPPPGKRSDGGALDLFSRKIVPKSGGEFLNTVILLDLKSNRVHTRIGSSSLENDPENFEVSLKMHRLESNAIHHTDRIYKSDNHASQNIVPPIPPETGISIRVEPNSTASIGKSPIMLYVSYNLPIRKNSEKKEQKENISEKKVIPFSFLATGTRIPIPLVWRVETINDSEMNDLNGNSIRGFFAIDLSQLVGIEENQTYYIYAFSGIALSEPGVLKLMPSLKK